jgi:hypothetical protein
MRLSASSVLPSIIAGRRDSSGIRYFLVDSRARKSGEMKGKFPTSIIVTPEVMLDSERLVEVLKDFEVLRGEATLVVMGEGVGVAKTEYGIELSPKAKREMEEDESRTER